MSPAPDEHRVRRARRGSACAGRSEAAARTSQESAEGRAMTASFFPIRLPPIVRPCRVLARLPAASAFYSAASGRVRQGEEGLDGPIPAAGRVRRPRSPRPAAAANAADPSPDVAEPGSVEAIAKFTTEPRFLSSWVAYVPASATVPSPTKFLGPRGRSRRGALPHGPDLRLLPGAREGDAPRAGRGDREVGGGPRDPARRDRRRGGDPEPRPPQGRDRGPRRPPDHEPGGGREDHRDGAADLLLQRGAPLDRDRQPRDGHGARLPARRLRAADDPATSARTWSCSSTRSPSPTAGTRPSTGSTATSRARPTRRTCPRGRRRTGATTSSTTTTATRTRRRCS